MLEESNRLLRTCWVEAKAAGEDSPRPSFTDVRWVKLPGLVGLAINQKIPLNRKIFTRATKKRKKRKSGITMNNSWTHQSSRNQELGKTRDQNVTYVLTRTQILVCKLHTYMISLDIYPFYLSIVFLPFVAGFCCRKQPTRPSVPRLFSKTVQSVAAPCRAPCRQSQLKWHTGQRQGP